MYRDTILYLKTNLPLSVGYFFLFFKDMFKLKIKFTTKK